MVKKVLAAFIFFTRLPLWRYADVPSEYFGRVVEMWPLVGWLTGGVSAAVLYGASLILPIPAAVVIALGARLMLTGALHEDGLADFIDGMGGGASRERILAIMKDSHIGSYGVLGLVVYALLMVALWSSLEPEQACVVIMAGDPWSKFCAAQIINFLPYARRAEDSKSGTVYRRFTVGAWTAALVIGALPAVLLPPRLLYAYIAPAVATALLILLMRKKIGGYTGDCCGATFLISELAFYIAAVAIMH